MHASPGERINEKAVCRVRRKWRHRIPAMSAGITDHVWNLRDLLIFKTALMSTS
jgi:hypothetical protein